MAKQASFLCSFDLAQTLCFATRLLVMAKQASFLCSFDLTQTVSEHRDDLVEVAHDAEVGFSLDIY